MMKILIGVDDSEESHHAVEVAVEFFGPDAHYLIASIGEPVPLYSTASFASASALTPTLLSSEFTAAKAAANKTALEAVVDLPADAETVVEVGHAGPSLVDLATEENVNAIVIGSQDKKVWERLLNPSVGRYLIDNAPCPVVVVR